jgi:glycosyltransferase involved in cell wall biosynthesis
MKVLHVNDVDLPGRRFNGYELLHSLKTRGISGKQAVLTKFSEDPDVIQIIDGAGDSELQCRIRAVEQRHSMHDLLFPWGRLLAQSQEFHDADVVHYHLIHNHMISLLDLTMLFAQKPSVWTFHDPWPMTGHCVYPMGCERWMTGCAGCPSLDAVFPMNTDCADRMWRIKRSVYSRIDVDIVVASEFMLDMVHCSPLTSKFDRVHLIPFGIETCSALADDAKMESRRHLGIPEVDFVLFFRETASPVKGLRHIVEALESHRPERPTTLLTVDQRGLLGSLDSNYNVVELGWVDDPDLQQLLYSACDVFLMPSTAEAFGLMALEAMAAGRPVICFEGTALPSVTHAPECGIAVPMGDSSALRRAIDGLCGDPVDAARRGAMGRRLASENYDYEVFLDSLAGLYRSAIR